MALPLSRVAPLTAAGAALGVVTSCPLRAAADAEVIITTDRPAVTESSIVVAQGGLQVENGLQVTDTMGHDVLDLPESLVRYGLLEKTELRLTVPDYYHGLSGSAAAAAGFGDMAIGTKQQLGPVGGFDLSVIAFVSLPTGAEAITSHGYDPGLQLPWSRSLSAGWTVAGQLASYWPTQNGQRNYTTEVTLLFDRQLSAPWDAFIEYAGDFPQRGGSSQLLHIGTAYKISAHQQIDFHASAALSQAAPRWYVGCGYSFLHLSR
jgi:hypothetical protein